MVSALIFQSRLSNTAHLWQIKRVRQSQICASGSDYIAATVSFNGNPKLRLLSLLAKPFFLVIFQNPPSYSRFIELKAKICDL